MSQAEGDVAVVMFICFAGMLALTVLFSGGGGREPSGVPEPEGAEPLGRGPSLDSKPVRPTGGAPVDPGILGATLPETALQKGGSASEVKGMSSLPLGSTSIDEAFPDPLRRTN